MKCMERNSTSLGIQSVIHACLLPKTNDGMYETQLPLATKDGMYETELPLEFKVSFTHVYPPENSRWNV